MNTFSNVVFHLLLFSNNSKTIELQPQAPKCFSHEFSKGNLANFQFSARRDNSIENSKFHDQHLIAKVTDPDNMELYFTKIEIATGLVEAEKKEFQTRIAVEGQHVTCLCLFGGTSSVQAKMKITGSNRSSILQWVVSILVVAVIGGIDIYIRCCVADISYRLYYYSIFFGVIVTIWLVLVHSWFPAANNSAILRFIFQEIWLLLKSLPVQGEWWLATAVQMLAYLAAIIKSDDIWIGAGTATTIAAALGLLTGKLACAAYSLIMVPVILVAFALACATWDQFRLKRDNTMRAFRARPRPSPIQAGQASVYVSTRTTSNSTTAATEIAHQEAIDVSAEQERQDELSLDENDSGESDVDIASIPEEFRCVISLNIMKDPVMCADGHSYERRYIKRWLATNATSPITGSALPHKELLPNYALRSAIERFVMQLSK